jgi:hypothetical protein
VKIALFIYTNLKEKVPIIRDTPNVSAAIDFTFNLAALGFIYD